MPDHQNQPDTAAVCSGDGHATPDPVRQLAGRACEDNGWVLLEGDCSECGERVVGAHRWEDGVVVEFVWWSRPVEVSR
jgi:hypothetical protein